MSRDAPVVQYAHARSYSQLVVALLPVPPAAMARACAQLNQVVLDNFCAHCVCLPFALVMRLLHHRDNAYGVAENQPEEPLDDTKIWALCLLESGSSTFRDAKPADAPDISSHASHEGPLENSAAYKKFWETDFAMTERAAPIPAPPHVVETQKPTVDNERPLVMMVKPTQLYALLQIGAEMADANQLDTILQCVQEQSRVATSCLGNSMLASYDQSARRQPGETTRERTNEHAPRSEGRVAHW